MARSTDRGLPLSQIDRCGVVPGEMVSFYAGSEITRVSSTDPLNLHCCQLGLQQHYLKNIAEMETVLKKCLREFSMMCFETS